MSKVTIELSEYNALRDASKELEQANKNLEEANKAHAKEIQQLKEEGKIAVMVESPFGRLFGGKPHIVEIVGIEKVRSQIEEHIIDEEVKKANATLIKELAEAKTKISDLKEDIEQLKGRSLWQRIRNKF